MASGDELLKVATHLGSANNMSTAQTILTAGSGKTVTIISMSLCETAGADETFDVYIDTASGAHAYLYLEQSLPSKSTFVHNDKIILEAADHLDVHVNADGGDIDIIIAYLEQEL
jgi:ribonucleotide monophosphatase NagD (HAD superfamily)